MAILLSLGAINGLIPIIIILILLVAAAGLNRGYSLFNFFGITTFSAINPAGKASLAGKNAFVLPLLGHHAGELMVGSRLRAAKGRSKSAKFTGKTLIGAAGGRPPLPKRAAARILAPMAAVMPTGGRATMFRRRTGRRLRKVFTGVPGKPTGARNRLRKMGSWTAAKASGVNATLAGSSALYGKTVGKAVSGVSKTSSALKRRWQGRSRKTKVAMGGALGLGILAVNPILGLSYGVLRSGHAYRLRNTRFQANASAKRQDSHFVRNLDKRLPQHIRGVGSTVALMGVPPLYLGYRASQKAVDVGYRKPIERSKIAADSRYDSARDIIAVHSAKYAGDLSQMTRKEHKAMEKAVIDEVKKIHYAAAKPGSYDHSITSAALLGIYHAMKGPQGGYDFTGYGAPAARSAAGLASPAVLVPGGALAPMKIRDLPAKVREKISEAGTKPTSTPYTRAYRGITGMAGVAAATGGLTAGSIMRNRSLTRGISQAKEDRLAAAGSPNETAASMLSGARREHLKRLSNPERIDAFMRKYEDNLSDRQSEVTSLNNEATRLSNASAVAARAARHEDAARLAKEAKERSDEAAQQAKILSDKQRELNRIHVTAASNAFTSQSTLQDLHDNHGAANADLRTALAGNSHTPVDVLRTIATTGAAGEKLAAASNPSTPRDVLETMAASPYKDMSEGDISKAPAGRATDMRDEAEIANTADRTLKERMAIARDTSTAKPALDAIARGGSSEERVTVASNSSASEETLDSIATTGNVAEQLSVASNSSASETTLRSLQASANVGVSATAAETLRKKLSRKRS